MFNKVWYLLTAEQRISAIVLFGLLFIGMMLETLGIGLVIPAFALITQSNLAEKYRYDTTNQILSIGDTELSCSSSEQFLTCNRLDEDEDYFYKWHFQIDTASLKNEFRKQGEFASKEHLIHTQGECLISN